MKAFTVLIFVMSIDQCRMRLVRSSRSGQRRNSRLMNWNRLNTDIQEVAMPRGLNENSSLSEATSSINNKLQDLKLVKDRRSKSINEVQNQIIEAGARQAQETSAKTSFNNTDKDGGGDIEQDDNDTVCVQKVMQVPETVWEEKVVCHHKFNEKCHNTFITDYVPTQERKCHTSYNKKCRISYKPSVSKETVSVCRDSLEKHCDEATVGKGETVCRTVYQTQCNTRYNEMTMEEDQPVCEIVTETKCDETTTNSPDNEAMMIPNFINSDEKKCVEWPVKKCKLEKKTVKKVKPETWCEKMSQNVCAPSNCVISVGEKKCQDEVRNVLLSTPSEECDLEPVDDCRMETVLVPRLVEKPKCIKVPREVCVNQRINPKKLFRPVIREWCYKPSQYRNSKIPDNRNIRQFVNKNSLF